MNKSRLVVSFLKYWGMCRIYIPNSSNCKQNRIKKMLNGWHSPSSQINNEND